MTAKTSWTGITKAYAARVLRTHGFDPDEAWAAIVRAETNGTGVAYAYSPGSVSAKVTIQGEDEWDVELRDVFNAPKATPDENAALVEALAGNAAKAETVAANVALVETLAEAYMAVAASGDPKLASSGTPVYDGIQRSLLGAIRIAYALDHDEAHQVYVIFIQNGGDSWILVDASVCSEDDDLRPWVARGVAHARSLPSK
jgi:hypothetical protein